MLGFTSQGTRQGAALSELIGLLDNRGRISIAYHQDRVEIRALDPELGPGDLHGVVLPVGAEEAPEPVLIRENPPRLDPLPHRVLRHERHGTLIEIV